MTYNIWKLKPGFPNLPSLHGKAKFKKHWYRKINFFRVTHTQHT